AARPARRADGRPELHEGLVQVAGALALDEGLRLGPEPRLHRRRAEGELDAVEAGEDAGDVAVDDGLGEIESDRTDGACRVTAHPGERAPRRRIARDLTAVSRHDLLRAGVQEARAAVVAEAGERGEHLVLARGCERLHRGETSDEALEVG